MKKLLLILLVFPSLVIAQDIKEVWFTRNGEMVSSLCLDTVGYQLNFKGNNCNKWEIEFPNYFSFNGGRSKESNSQFQQQQFKINSATENAIITQVKFKHKVTRKVLTFKLDNRVSRPVFVGYHCPK